MLCLYYLQNQHHDHSISPFPWWIGLLDSEVSLHLRYLVHSSLFLKPLALYQTIHFFRFLPKFTCEYYGSLLVGNVFFAGRPKSPLFLVLGLQLLGRNLFLRSIWSPLSKELSSRPTAMTKSGTKKLPSLRPAWFFNPSWIIRAARKDILSLAMEYNSPCFLLNTYGQVRVIMV